MTLSDIALKRPVGAIVLSLVIILMGVVGYNFLGVRLYPAIDPPIITVQTNYTGANDNIIESQVTEPLEKSINGIEGVKTISSQSATGVSTITVEFNLDADLEKAANDVRDKVSQAQKSLPQDIDAPPTVTKADANSDPIVMLTAQSANMNPMQLSDYAENVLQEKLQTIPGISSVAIYGQQRPAMRLWFDPAKMAAFHLTASDVDVALTKENVDVPGGKIRGNATELTIKTFGRLVTEDDFNNLIVKQTDNQVIRLRDIGNAVVGPQDDEAGSTINGVTGVMLVLIPLPGANDIQIADEFYKRMDQIKSTMPKGLELSVARDKSIFVRQSVSDVVETLIIAILLVVMIIFLFFRNWIIALRPLLDIPVSLIGTFFVMYLLGFSINVLTLLGIVLATGLVVDDGIVVTENIFKRIEQGMDKFQAALEGTREIFFAVISTSLTLAIVFIPVIFLQGFTGRLFREFGIVVASAVLISALVSLTLTPVLNVFLGGSGSHHSKFYVASEPFFVGMEKKYRRFLSFFILNKWVALSIIGLCIVFIFSISKVLKSELAPLEDHSYLRTSVTAPEGTESATTKKVLDRISKISSDNFPETKYAMARYGGGTSANTGFVITFLTDPSERKRSQQDIYKKLTKLYDSIPEARVIASQEPTITTSNSRGLPVQFVLQNLDFDKIQKILPKFLDEAQSSPVFSNVDVDLKFNKPEVNIVVDRLKATSLGVNEKDISDALDLAYSGSRYAYYLNNSKQYYVIGEMARNDRKTSSDISSLYVRNNAGNMIQLDNLVSMKENSNPPILYHFNRYKSATVSANLAEGKTLGEGIAEMRRIADKLLDSSFNTALSGPSRDFAESNSNIGFALILALLLIYLILAAQFESFTDPVIIMFTVPMAIAGAMLSLWIFGQTLNIFSEIGMILLIGIVTKNGILIVEFANQKRALGMNKRLAAFESASARFRPILMTSLATIFGAFPIALAMGAGATSRVSLGIVVVGGLLFSLVLTLFVIPVIYTLSWKETIKILKKRIQQILKWLKKFKGIRLGFVLLFIFALSNANAQKALTLDDAVRIALKNNFDILVAGNEAKTDKVNNTAGNAGMLPTVGITGSGSYGISDTKQKTYPNTTTNYPSLSTTVLSAGAQLNWNVYDGGKMFVTKSKLNEIQALGEIQYRDKVLQTLYNVIAAYYDVVRQKQQLSSINVALNYNKDRVTIAQAGFNAGSLVKTDLLQAKIDLNVNTETAIDQQYTIDVAQKTLNQLLGKNTDDPFEISDTIPLNYTPDKADLLKKIDRSNTSILSYQKQIEIAQLALKENKSLYLPTFSVRAGYYASQTVNSAGSTLNSSSAGPQVGGTLTIPVFSAGETKRKVTTAKIQAESAEYNLQNIKLQVKILLMNTLTEFENQQRLLKIESENNLLAKENIQISLERLKLGQTTSLEVHLAQEDYVQSSTRLINFRYNLKMAETKLKQLVSGL